MNQSIRVFYFEDEPTAAQQVMTLLEQPRARPGEPTIEVSHYLRAGLAFRAIEQWSGHPPDVALLDRDQYNYSGAGLDLCEEIKETWPQVPVVFLSGHASIADQSAGRKAGASTYLSKELLKEPDGKEIIRTAILSQISTCTPPQ